MQDRYVGDVGDFGKYGLLRALCIPRPGDSGPRLKLGVIWYLVPDETLTNDGKHTEYLKPTPQNHLRFRECDPELYDTLQQLVDSGQRNVEAVERSNILGRDTAYYSRLLTYEGQRTSLQRLAFREAWMSEAIEAVKDCDLVFVDPDNGLESSVRKQDKNGVKYAYYDEITKLVEEGKSVVVYHHLSRQGNALTQISNKLTELSLVAGPQAQIIPLQFRRGSARVFFLVVKQKLIECFLAGMALISGGSWGQHFSAPVSQSLLAFNNTPPRE